MRKLLSLIACLGLVATLAACSADAGSSGEGSDDPTTTVAPDDDPATTEGGDDPTTTDVPTTTDDPTTTEGGTDPDADVYVEALVTGMSSGDPSEDLVLREDEARCVAPVWIDTIGLDALAEVDPEDLADPDLDLGELTVDEDQAATMIGAYGDCDIDIQEKFAGYLADALPEEQATCVTGALAEEDLIGLLELALVDDDAAETEFNATLEPIFTACGVS